MDKQCLYQLTCGQGDKDHIIHVATHRSVAQDNVVHEVLGKWAPT